MSAERAMQFVIPGLLLQHDPMVQEIERIMGQTNMNDPADRMRSDILVRKAIANRLRVLGDAYYGIWIDTRNVTMNDCDR